MCDGVLSGRNPRTRNIPKAKQAESLGRTLTAIAEDHELAIIAPLTPTHLSANLRHRPEILDLAVLKGVVLNLARGSFTGKEQPIEAKTIIDLKRVLTALEEVDTPNLNVIHIRPVIKRCQRKVLANLDRRGLPADVRELIKAKYAALCRTSAYPTPEYRS
ncbi:hypothetical protein EVAR_15745_1 [Eumeta japonica]|uniref:Uncharacterized protein n=1 Tax=Eumeta variegata TaxID=151549 RepID=A0A4C1Z803_EUMVA|nr:hypothetical protein EVAR_15745_1 [Eumeta japonica]